MVRVLVNEGTTMVFFGVVRPRMHAMKHWQESILWIC